MIIKQNGDTIGGGGLPVITVPYATYIANKAQYDAPDVLVRVPDYPKGKMPASYVGYDSHLGLDDVGNIATKSLGKVEYRSDDVALYAHAVGEYFINKDGEYCKCTSAISVGQTLTKNTNYTVTDIASEIKGINKVITSSDSTIKGALTKLIHSAYSELVKGQVAPAQATVVGTDIMNGVVTRLSNANDAVAFMYMAYDFYSVRRVSASNVIIIKYTGTAI